MKLSIKKIVTLAMLAAMAYVVMCFIKIPFIPGFDFLKYEPKDVLFVLAGFLVGPIESLIIIIVVCFIEMVTVSNSGPVGLWMNLISSICFVLPAALIYRKKKSIPAAVIGLAIGVVCMTASMILWNYLVTPGYMNIDQAVVVSLLPTVFLPFNLIKASINMAVALIIYKPISIALRKSGLLEESNKKDDTKKENSKKKFSPWAIIIGIFLLGGCIAAILMMRG